MSAHTPGPWRAVIGQDQPQLLYRSIVAIVSDEPRITVVQDQELTVDAEEWEANARLIATAPALLQALRVCLSVLEDVQRSHGLSKDSLFSVTDARAAIAEATGESK